MEREGIIITIISFSRVFFRNDELTLSGPGGGILTPSWFLLNNSKLEKDNALFFSDF